jgi:hypothetical protein
MTDRTETVNPFGVSVAQGDNRNATLENDNLVSIERMKAKLADEDETYYTPERLQNMTYNDLVYAVRYGTADPLEVPTEEET